MNKVDDFLYKIGPGWQPIVIEAFKQLSDLNVPELAVMQVKEKYACLVIHTNMYTGEICRIISKAGDAASKVCEACGSVEYVEMRKVRSWFKCECPSCHTERENKYV